MAHNPDTTNTDITPTSNMAVVIMPPNVSSMLQPLDEPVFHPISLSDLIEVQSDTTSNDNTSDSDTWSTTSSMPDLRSISSQSLPDLVDVDSDSGTDDSSSDEEENTQGVLIVDGYNFNPYILNVDEIMATANQLISNRPRLRIVPRARPPTRDFNKADMP